MCKTQHDVQSPDPMAVSAVNDSVGGFMSGAPLPTQTQPAETKFGKLLKVIMPIAQGAGIGATQDTRQGGAGFAASSNYFRQQKEQEIQQQELQRQNALALSEMGLRQQQGLYDAARTQHELNAPKFPNIKTRTVVDADGKPHVESTNPYTGAWEEGGTAKPPDKRVQYLSTDKGFVPAETQGPEAGTVGAPLTAPSTPVAPEESKMIPGLPIQQPDIPGAPLMPADKPEGPRTVAPGSELVDPKTGRVIAKGAPKPPPRGRATPPKPDTSKVETYAQDVLRELGPQATDAQIEQAINGANADGATKAAVRARVREIKRPIQPKGSPSSRVKDAMNKMLVQGQ